MCLLFIYTHTFIKVSEAWTGVFSEGSAQTAQRAPHPPEPANTSLRLFTFTAQCQDSRRQGSRCLPHWRGYTTYLKVVRWQKNEETLGTAAAASQRLPGHPPPARSALCVCVLRHILKLSKISWSPANGQAQGVEQNGVQQNTKQYLP